jgi:hypothetical protein
MSADDVDLAANDDASDDADERRFDTLIAMVRDDE